MSKPNSAMGRSRDFGIPGGPGKGDKSRVTNQSAYAQNFDEINWGRPREDRSKPNPAWVNANPFIENEAEWPNRDTVVDGLKLDATPVTNDIVRE